MITKYNITTFGILVKPSSVSSRKKIPMKNITPHKTDLTFQEAVETWLYSWAGEYQHQIAARFGVNQGRVSEVLNEHKHTGSREMALRGRAA